MKRLGIGAMALIGCLGLMLLGVSYFVYEGFAVNQGPVPSDFYIAMTLGVVFSLVVGIGLMTLVFYSSRKGYDEPPRFRDSMSSCDALRPERSPTSNRAFHLD
jgi:hypothetical protein